MAALEGIKAKSGTFYRIIYYWNGKKERFKVGITSKRTADQRKAQLETLLALGKNPKDELLTINTSKTSLSQLLEIDSEWCKPRKRSRTIELNEWAINGLIGWANDIPVIDVNKSFIEKYIGYLEKQGRKHTTINMQLRQLKAIFQRAIDEHDIIKEHSFRSIKPLSVAKTSPKPKFLTINQVNIMLDSITNLHFKKLTQFYLLTGCRRTEAVELKWDDVDWDNEVIHLGQPDSQTKIYRTFPLSINLINLLNDVKNDSKEQDLVFYRFAKDYAHISVRYKQLREKIEHLPNFLTTHSLRHTFASHLVMQGVDLTTISSLMGHTTTKVTELYAHLLPDHKKLAVEKLPY